MRLRRWHPGKAALLSFAVLLSILPALVLQQTEAAAPEPSSEAPAAAATPAPTPTPGLRTKDMPPGPFPTPSLVWTTEFGSDGTDSAAPVAVSGSGSVYVGGSAHGTFPGQTAGGGRDAFVARVDGSGNLQWARQWGTSLEEITEGVGTDGNGNVYVAGDRDGEMRGTLIGAFNGFIARYDSAGNQIWNRTFSSANTMYTKGLAVGGTGNIYAAGYTYGVFEGQSLSTPSSQMDAFIVRYDAEGNMLWVRQFGTGTSDAAQAVAADGLGNAYVAGYTLGAYPGQTYLGADDVYIRKYNSSGVALWTTEFGTGSQDVGRAVGVDAAGNSYAAGDTYGTFPGQTPSGLQDGFVAKCDSSGNILWTRQFGTGAYDYTTAMAVDPSGNVFVTGYTWGVFPGQMGGGGGSADAFVLKYDGAGNLLWTAQYGTNYEDYAGGIAVDGSGNIYVAGYTRGTFPGQTISGYWDAFLIKLGDAPAATPTPSPFPSPTPWPTPWPSPTLTETPGPFPSPTPTPWVGPTPTPTPGPFPTPTPSPGYLPGDVNRDGVVNTTDLSLAAASFNKRNGESGFNPNADFNGDGLVDIYDLVVVGLNFGRTT